MLLIVEEIIREKGHQRDVDLSSFELGFLISIIDSRISMLIRRIAKKVLDGEGYRLIEAKCGIIALEAADTFDEKRPDLLITHVIMPGTSGRKLVDKLNERHPDLKVLFISGYTNDVIVGDSSL